MSGQATCFELRRRMRALVAATALVIMSCAGAAVAADHAAKTSTHADLAVVAHAQNAERGVTERSGGHSATPSASGHAFALAPGAATSSRIAGSHVSARSLWFDSPPGRAPPTDARSL